VTPGKQTIYGLNRRKSMTAEILDKKGEPIPGVAVSWSSSKPAVATIDEKTGALKTVADGKTVITAKAGELSGSGNIDVVDAVSINVLPARVTLAGPRGSTATLSYEVKDSKGKTIEVKPSWSSSDAGIVSVDGHGVLKSQKEGKATITASLGDVGGGCDVAVTFREIGGVELAPSTLILGRGETQSVRAVARDDKGASIEDAAIGWSTSDPAVATCYNGMVTGKATGTATIRASCGSKTAELSVFVN
jgi:uncharacterized protein YjdB